MNLEWIDSCKRIDFEKLADLVGDRVNILRAYVEAADGADPTHNAICRDLIMPCVGLLAQFVDCVNISELAEK